MEWTDRHCRYFHRQLSRRARLYTEMLTTGTLVHGDVARHLGFDEAEHPLALQLGGSEPEDLAHAARLGEQWGYDEVNLNCGCPSERVQRGAFGACLMAEPSLVAECVRAMRDAVAIPISVKHRIGIDRRDDYGFVRDFVGAVHDAGCNVFIVHARSAWLKGLSPKENREIPPLDYTRVERLKRDFPAATFVLNGGIASLPDAVRQLAGFSGVMLGRAAYHDPYLLADVDRVVFGDDTAPLSRVDVALRMSEYVQRQARQGTQPRHIVRHMLGLFHGLPGARQWRRVLSDAQCLRQFDADILLHALNVVEAPSMMRAA